MPIYQGANSCHALREGIYVRRVARPGLDTVAEAAAIAFMILRDYHRGYTYRHKACRKVKMTRELLVKRLEYIIALASVHGASKRELSIIKRMVHYVLTKRRLPKKVGGRETKKLLKKMIVHKR